jgi:hypothetical protein
MRVVASRIRRDDSGLSLAEVLVSAMLTLGILIMVGTMFVQTTRITTASNQTRNSNGVASNVANAVTSVIRVSTTLAKANTATPDPAVVTAGRSTLTVYSLSNTDPQNPAPVRVSFTLDTNGRITETRCVGKASSIYWTFGTCASTSTRVLGDGLLDMADGASPLFIYRDVNRVVLDPGTGTLNAANRAKVASIEVVVTAQAPGSETEPVVLRNTVVLRNLGLDSVE